VHIFKPVRLCVQSIKFMYVVIASHIYTTIHYTNNTMAYGIGYSKIYPVNL